MSSSWRVALAAGLLAVWISTLVGAETTPCPAGRFKCGARCIANEFVCDGESDCEDGSDEASCQTCSARAYRCRGGACRHHGVRCNERPDCPDESDEEACPPVDPKKRYTCYGNRTTDLEFHCDGYNTCDDGDEYHCDTCQGGAFHCGSNCTLSFKCIKASAVCDGQQEYPFTNEEAGCAPDGPGSMNGLETAARLRVGSVVARGRDWRWGDVDGSGVGVVASLIDMDGWVAVNWTHSGEVSRVRMGNDTKYDLKIVVTKKECPPDRFACDDGRCIHRDFVCDGLPTCADKTDEADCKWCSPRAFQCAPGGGCLHQNLLCDGTNHCPYGRDEENCADRILPRNKRFFCQSDRSIIPESLQCDGQLDCSNGEDEADCKRHEWSHPPGKSLSGAYAGCQGGALYCSNQRCLNPGLVCDGVRDCPDGEDEVDCAPVGALKLRGPEAAARLKVGSVVVRGNDSWLSPYPDKEVPPEPAKGVVRSRINNYGRLSVFWPDINKTTDEYMAHTDWSREVYKYYYDLHVLTKESKQEACGIAARGDGPLVFSETLAPLGTFPWHAGIYLKKDSNYTGICGGSLISSTVIVTAAHCVTEKYSGTTSPDKLVVALGKFRSGWDEEKEGVHKSAISEILVHPTYKGQYGGYSNDIALLRMSDEILNFGKAISPVCINGGIGLQANEGMQIAGWGYGAQLRPELASITVQYKPYSACVAYVRETSNKHLGWITSDKICSVRQADLAFSTREGLARGDSGSGAVVQRGAAWFLVGVVSTSFNNETVYTFTEVEQFLPWVRQQTTRPEEIAATTAKEVVSNTTAKQAVTSTTVKEVVSTTEKTIPVTKTYDARTTQADAYSLIVFPGPTGG